jgi:hypothetical protein
MRPALPALAAIAIMVTPAHAASPEKRAEAKSVSQARSLADAPNPRSLELARELFELLNPDYVNDVRETALAQVDQIEDAREKAAARGDMERYLTSATPLIIKHYPSIKKAYVTAYAREFQADELQQLIAFAATPTGRRFLDRYQEFNSDPGVGEAIGSMTQDLQPMYDDFYKAKCQRATARRVAAGDVNAKCPMA